MSEINWEETRKAYIKSRGFKSVLEFSKTINDDPSNVLKVLQGKQRPEIQKMFLWANTLNADITEILNLFYPDEMQTNKENVKTIGKALL